VNEMNKFSVGEFLRSVSIAIHKEYNKFHKNPDIVVVSESVLGCIDFNGLDWQSMKVYTDKPSRGIIGCVGGVNIYSESNCPESNSIVFVKQDDIIYGSIV
jgi:hypothetical protein